MAQVEMGEMELSSNLPNLKSVRLPRIERRVET